MPAKLDPPHRWEERDDARGFLGRLTLWNLGASNGLAGEQRSPSCMAGGLTAFCTHLTTTVPNALQVGVLGRAAWRKCAAA